MILDAVGEDDIGRPRRCATGWARRSWFWELRLTSGATHPGEVRGPAQTEILLKQNLSPIVMMTEDSETIISALGFAPPTDVRGRLSIADIFAKS